MAINLYPAGRGLESNNCSKCQSFLRKWFVYFSDLCKFEKTNSYSLLMQKPVIKSSKSLYSHESFNPEEKIHPVGCNSRGITDDTSAF
jgi:hypothetical protein